MAVGNVISRLWRHPPKHRGALKNKRRAKKDLSRSRRRDDKLEINLDEPGFAGGV